MWPKLLICLRKVDHWWFVPNFYFYLCSGSRFNIFDQILPDYIISSGVGLYFTQWVWEEVFMSF